MEKSYIGLCVLVLIAIAGTLIGLLERRADRSAEPGLKRQAANVQRRRRN